jgi:hypothetical protein
MTNHIEDLLDRATLDEQIAVGTSSRDIAVRLEVTPSPA